MLRCEFFERTGVEPTNNEYYQIEDDYYNSDLNKDDFCKEWLNGDGLTQLVNGRQSQIDDLTLLVEQNKKSIHQWQKDYAKLHEECVDIRKDYIVAQRQAKKQLDEMYKRFREMENRALEAEKQLATIKDAFAILSK